MAFRGKGRGKPKFKKEKPEFDQTIVDLARVTRVTKGGKQLSFRATILLGDRKGRVGYGVAKGKDVQMAVEKAVSQAKKNIIRVPFDDITIPHRVEAKFKAGKVMIKPAPQGSGIIAGSAIRTVLELAGVPNASAKMLGKSNNKISNIKTTFVALQSFRPDAVAHINKKKEQQKTPEVKEEMVKPKVKKAKKDKNDGKVSAPEKTKTIDKEEIKK